VGVGARRVIRFGFEGGLGFGYESEQ